MNEQQPTQGDRFLGSGIYHDIPISMMTYEYNMCIIFMNQNNLKRNSGCLAMKIDPIFRRCANLFPASVQAEMVGAKPKKMRSMQPDGVNLKALYLLVAVSSAVMMGMVIRGNAQSKLPEGPNRALVERECGSCHDIEQVAINGRSEAGWNGTIEEMTGYGLRVTPAERALILEYLKTYLPPR